ncbi:MAG: hypothetical protein OEZ34_06650 [Spirochaetia bacterium]|nr:hypothetical protein [Spirochaetia bacterium]
MLSLRSLYFSVILSIPFMGCTNYSSSPNGFIVNTPIITQITISPNGTGGHYIEMSAQNTEIGFLGYRIFQSTTEAGLLNAPPASGTDCSQLYLIPNQGITYRIEVDPLAVAPPVDNPNNIICFTNISLIPGNYAGIRALKTSDFFSITTGLSSNAAIVP